MTGNENSVKQQGELSKSLGEIDNNNLLSLPEG